MVKVITYGTYDLLHEGHLRLLQRAKALGDYLIVGVTGDGFDRTRGKINVQQSLMERIENVRQTGLADQIIVEEYEGQKIDDIRRYDVDIFTVGSDWEGKFDYLNEFCKVIYLERTSGISSTDIRSEKREVRIGLVGESPILNKFHKESKFVNGVKISGICTEDTRYLEREILDLPVVTNDYEELMRVCDAVYVLSEPNLHYSQIKRALEQGKHVLCESPIALCLEEYEELDKMASEKGLVLMDGIKTAYSMAFNRMLLLLKGGIIGDVVSVDATCTSLSQLQANGGRIDSHSWNTMCFWGTTALLPVFDILGTDYEQKQISSRMLDSERKFDLFSKITFVYPHAVASIKVGQGVKSEGELVVSGTKGYVYVPAPWWKTDYFEVRYENQSDNKRFFYQLDGEGIRYEILSFVRQIESGARHSCIDKEVTKAMIRIVESFYRGDIREI